MAEVDTLDVEDATQQVATVATLSKVIKTLGLPSDVKVTDPDSVTATDLAIQKGILQKLTDSIYAVGVRASANAISVGPSSDGKFQTISGGSQYKDTAAGQTANILGATGAAGDYLDVLTCVVTAAASSNVAVLDGNSSFTVLPANVASGINTYIIPCGWVSVNGAWKITTGAGVTVRASGIFT